jgi:acyl carrier protein
MSNLEIIRKYVHENISRELDDDDEFRTYADSLRLLDLANFVEREFGLYFEPSDLQIVHFSSISAVDRFVKSKQG